VNNYAAIRQHYESVRPQIMSEEANEWAIEPYQWELVGIRMTPIEEWLWHDIRAVDAVLYPQFPVGPYFVDFANPKEKVAIECDGAAYHTNKDRDAKRDAWLRSQGWKVYRITGRDCRDGVDSEEPSKSAARQFMKRVCAAHIISRFDRQG